MVSIGGCALARMMPRFTGLPSVMKERVMEAHRRRRTRDDARKVWYAHHRQVRFARWLGFVGDTVSLDQRLVDSRSTGPTKAQPRGSSEPLMNASCSTQREDFDERQFQLSSCSLR
jgi:hypothetical protein